MMPHVAVQRQQPAWSDLHSDSASQSATRRIGRTVHWAIPTTRHRLKGTSAGSMHSVLFHRGRFALPCLPCFQERSDGVSRQMTYCRPRVLPCFLDGYPRVTLTRP